jgi:hypothetical protein
LIAGSARICAEAVSFIEFAVVSEMIAQPVCVFPTIRVPVRMSTEV